MNLSSLGLGVTRVGRAIRALTSSFIDNFNTTLDTTTKWNTFSSGGGTVSLATGRLHLTNTTTGNALAWSKQNYSLANNACFVQCTTGFTVSPTSTAIWQYLRLKDFSQGSDVGNRVWARLQGDGTMQAYWNHLNGADQLLYSAAYVAATHYWWQFRANATTLFFETAPSTASNPPIATDWVTRGSVPIASLGFPLDTMQIMLTFEIFGTISGTPTPAEFDGLNTGT